MTTLSPEQRDAVLDPHPRTLVLAGAGSGKTRVLVARIAHLILDRGIRPHALLAFSFTRKACLEIAHRLARLVERAGEPLQLPQITFTFHAFAFKLVRTHFRLLGFPQSPRVVTDEDTPGPEAVFARFLEEWTGPRPEGAAGQLLDRMRPGATHVPDPRLTHLEAPYQRWKRRHGILELEDLVPLAIEVLAHPVADAIREALQFVLIDEFQDIDDTQHRMFQRLIGNKTGFSLYGDDDQAIYRWRGSNPELIRSYARREDVRTHVLATNYRCREPILSVASRVVEKDVRRVPKPAVAFRKGGKRPVCVAGPHQPRRLANALEAIHRRGYSYDAMAILVRDAFDAQVVRRVVRRQGIPVTRDIEGTGVRLLTLHGSKGLEFPVVLLPFFDHLRFPNRRLFEREANALRTRRRHARRALRRAQRLEARLDAFGGLSPPDGQASARMGPHWCRPLWSLLGRAECSAWRLLNEHRRLARRATLSRRLEILRKDAVWFPALDTACRRLAVERQERLAEERRLCYVAMTRAKDELWIFCDDWNTRSEFLRDIPRRLLERRESDTTGEN